MNTRREEELLARFTLPISQAFKCVIFMVNVKSFPEPYAHDF